MGFPHPLEVPKKIGPLFFLNIKVLESVGFPKISLIAFRGFFQIVPFKNDFRTLFLNPRQKQSPHWKKKKWKPWKKFPYSFKNITKPPFLVPIFGAPPFELFFFFEKKIRFEKKIKLFIRISKNPFQ